MKYCETCGRGVMKCLACGKSTTNVYRRDCFYDYNRSCATTPCRWIKIYICDDKCMNKLKEMEYNRELRHERRNLICNVLRKNYSPIVQNESIKIKEFINPQY